MLLFSPLFQLILKKQPEITKKHKNFTRLELKPAKIEAKIQMQRVQCFLTDH